MLVRPTRAFPRILAAVVIWAALAGIALSFVYPERPRTAHGWALLTLLGPVALLALEWLGDRMSAGIARAGGEARFSWRRVLLGVAAALALCALGLAGVSALRWALQ